MAVKSPLCTTVLGGLIKTSGTVEAPGRVVIWVPDVLVRGAFVKDQLCRPPLPLEREPNRRTTS